MSGINYLLDTNVVIGLLKAFPDAIDLLQQYPDMLEKCAVSQITRIHSLPSSAWRGKLAFTRYQALLGEGSSHRMHFVPQRIICLLALPSRW